MAGSGGLYAKYAANRQLSSKLQVLPCHLTNNSSLSTFRQITDTSLTSIKTQTMLKFKPLESKRYVTIKIQTTSRLKKDYFYTANNTIVTQRMREMHYEIGV